MSIQSDKVVTLGDAQVLYDDLADRVVGLKSAIKRPEFIVGNAEEVLSDRGETDEAVYLFRKTGGNAKAYNREKVKKLIGGTVAWNQLLDNTNSGAVANNGGSKSYDSATRTYTITQTATSTWLGFYTTRCIPEHKYFVSVYVKPSVSKNIMFGIEGSATTVNNVPTSGSVISCISTSSSVHAFVFYFNILNETGFTADYKDFIIIDLTAALGSTIADYLYTLETQTAGSGVAVFRSLFGKSFYQFNSGSLESVNVSEHRLTGKNLLNVTATSGGIYTVATNGVVTVNGTSDGIGLILGYITPFAPTTYKLNGCPSGGGENTYRLDARLVSTGLPISGSQDAGSGSEFTASERFYIFIRIPGGTAVSNKVFYPMVRLSTVSDSTFEPYQQFVYSLPNVTLRGIPKLVNNEIVFDGDELTPDGTVMRRFALVDLGTLTWSYDSSLHFFYTESLDSLLRKTGMRGAYPQNIVCSDYTVSSLATNATDSAFSAEPDKTIAFHYANYTQNKAYIYIKDTSYSDAATFKTSLSGKMLLYEVESITTESVDPYQELQVCNRYGTEEYIDRLATAETSPRDVAIPCGHQTFYPVNVFDYIDELTKPDADFIADANIQSGKYFSVGNGLYVSTQAIAQGAAIVPGTNCTAVSLADALNTINA